VTIQVRHLDPRRDPPAAFAAAAGPLEDLRPNHGAPAVAIHAAVLRCDRHGWAGTPQEFRMVPTWGCRHSAGWRNRPRRRTASCPRRPNPTHFPALWSAG